MEGEKNNKISFLDFEYDMGQLERFIDSFFDDEQPQPSIVKYLSIDIGYIVCINNWGYYQLYSWDNVENSGCLYFEGTKDECLKIMENESYRNE